MWATNIHQVTYAFLNADRMSEEQVLKESYPHCADKKHLFAHKVTNGNRYPLALHHVSAPSTEWLFHGNKPCKAAGLMQHDSNCQYMKKKK